MLSAYARTNAASMPGIFTAVFSDMSSMRLLSTRACIAGHFGLRLFQSGLPGSSFLRKYGAMACARCFGSPPVDERTAVGFKAVKTLRAICCLRSVAGGLVVEFAPVTFWESADVGTAMESARSTVAGIARVKALLTCLTGLPPQLTRLDFHVRHRGIENCGLA